MNIVGTANIDELSGRLKSGSMYGFYPSKKWHYSNINSNKGVPRNITFIGDSIFNAVKLNIQNYLKTNRYTNGLGYIPFTGTVNSDMYQVVVVNGTYVSAPSTDDEWGISGEVMKIGSASTISYTNKNQAGNDNDFLFNTFKLYYLRQSGGGVFQYRVDGGSWVQVDTSNTSSILGIITVTDLTLDKIKNHLIEIAGVSGSSWVYGIRTSLKNQSGITCDFINQGGTSAQQWVEKTHYKTYINDIKPDQIHIMLGYNDKGSNRTTEQFIGDITTIVDSCKLNSKSYTDVIIYGHYDVGISGNIGMPDTEYNDVIKLYDSALLEYCLLNDYSFFNLQEFIPTRPIGNDMLIWEDNIHLNSTGGIFFCAKIVESLTNLLELNVLSKQSDIYLDYLFSVENTRKIGFHTRTSQGALLAPSVYLTPLGSTSSLYAQCGSSRYEFQQGLNVIPVPVQVGYVSDALAQNNTLYRSSTQGGKLCFKDNSGTVNPLY